MFYPGSFPQKKTFLELLFLEKQAASCYIAFSWISSMVLKFHPFELVFNISKKSDGEKTPQGVRYWESDGCWLDLRICCAQSIKTAATRSNFSTMFYSFVSSDQCWSSRTRVPGELAELLDEMFSHISSAATFWLQIPSRLS